MNKTWKLTKRGERVLTVLSVLGFILLVYLLAGIWWDCNGDSCHFVWKAPFVGGID